MDWSDLTDKQWDIVRGLRKRYQQVPDVVFARSVNWAKNEVELFDILDTLPDVLPLLWSMEGRRWQRFSDTQQQAPV